MLQYVLPRPQYSMYKIKNFGLHVHGKDGYIACHLVMTAFLYMCIMWERALYTCKQYIIIACMWTTICISVMCMPYNIIMIKQILQMLMFSTLVCAYEAIDMLFKVHC